MGSEILHGVLTHKKDKILGEIVLGGPHLGHDFYTNLYILIYIIIVNPSLQYSSVGSLLRLLQYPVYW